VTNGLAPPANRDKDFRTELVWAGDQGLMLGGLVSYVDATKPLPPAEEERLLALAGAIIDGVQSYLTTKEGLYLSWHDRATEGAPNWREKFPGMGIAPGGDVFL
jgi:hypothetical protein